MKQTLSVIALALLLGTVPSVFFTQPAHAYDLNFDISSLTQQVKQEVNDQVDRTAKQVEQATKQQAKKADQLAEKTAKIAERQQDKSHRFTDNKLRACEKKQQKIHDKISTISSRGSNQLELFHSIAEKVKTFYAKKGYQAAGYDQLSTELDTLYDQSLVAVTATQNAGDDWNCSSNDPTEAMSSFRDAKLAEITTLKAYKDKVRELILLVKQAGGNA